MTHDLFGRVEGRWRVLRTSNAYSFVDLNQGPGRAEIHRKKPVGLLSPKARPEP